MKREDAIAESALIAEGIRSLQAEHYRAHEALENWGRYSRDRDDKPAGVISPAIYGAAPTSKWDHDAVGDAPQRIEYAYPPEKGDRAEPEPYEEGAARDLCERMHGPGGLPEYLRDVVKVVYYHRPAREDRMHEFCSPPCQASTFKERLGECLRYVGRFV